MPFVESILCGLTMFIYIESIRDCIQRRRHRSEEMVPVVLHSIIPHSYDIQYFAPISEDAVQEDDMCPICVEELATIRYRRKTVCGHMFCSDCLQEWFTKKKNCPLCVRSFNNESNIFITEYHY